MSTHLASVAEVIAGTGGIEMVIVMQQGADERQGERVIERLTALGFDAHRSAGGGRTVLGAVGGNAAAVDTLERPGLPGVKEARAGSKTY